MAPRAVRLGAGPGEAAELRLRYPASNLCRAGAGGGREGRLCRRSARRGAAGRCRQRRAACFVPLRATGAASRDRGSFQGAAGKCADGVPCSRPRGGLRRGRRRALPAAESRERRSNLVGRWQWQSAGPAPMCWKGAGGAMASVCHRVTHMPTRPVAEGGERVRGEECLCAEAALQLH